MTYRGDSEASAERLAALDEEIAKLEGRLTDVFWEQVAAVWRVPRHLDPSLAPLEARHDRIAKLEAAIERARSGPDAEPELPPVPQPSAGLFAAVREATAPALPQVMATVLDAQAGSSCVFVRDSGEEDALA